MALLKDLIVQGASRFIGDAYFATIKAGVWNGTPIDLSHGGTAGETTAGKILTSTTTSGTSAWTAASSITVGTATTATKLSTVSKTAWGLTYWTSGGVPDSISGDMTSVGNITPSANVSKNCGSSSNAWNYVYAKYLTSNTTLWLTSGTGTSIVFCPAGTQCGKINPSGNLILGLDDNTTPAANNVTDKLYVNGATTITGTLTLTKTQDLAGTANNSPALIIGGPATGVHMEIDSNEIHAKLTGTTVAPLYLNNEGGLVYARGKVLAELDATTTTAGLVFVSTTTEGRGEWKAASNVTSGNATYAANVGATGTAGTNYVTAAKVIATCNWYDTMIASSDTDALINRWKEVCDFLNNFTEADTLASVLSTYVTLGTAQTITGAKTFANPISGDLLGNATTADRLKSTTAVGGAGTPVYFTGGLPVACTAANVRTFLGLGTVYSHAHTDYVTNVSYDSTNRKLQQSKGGGTATDIVTFGTGAFATIADYLPLAGGTMTGASPLTFTSNTFSVNFRNHESYKTGFYYGTSGNEALTLAAQNGVTRILFITGQDPTTLVNSSWQTLVPGLQIIQNKVVINKAYTTNTFPTYNLEVSGTTSLEGTIIATADYATQLEIWRKTTNAFSCIKYSNGTTKNVLGHIGIAAGDGSLVAANRPYWSTGDSSVYYQIVHSTGKTAVGGTSTPVYVDANGQLQTCTAYSSASVSYAASAGQIRTQSVATNASYYLTFVDSNNSSATAETLYTDAGITYNPSTNLLTVEKLTASGVVNLSGSTTIDSLTAGNLIVTGASTLTGNVSMGTVTAGTWNGSTIGVAYGGTGCTTLTSGSALIGNGTGAVTFRSIDNTTTVGSLMNVTTWALSTNLVTRNAIAYWDGRYQTTSNASNLAYCNKGAFGTVITRAYATAISTASGTASASNNNYNSDSYVPTNNAVYNFVTSTLGVSTTITKTAITKSLNSSTWTETGYTLYGESQGSYMLQITDSTTSTVFTGVFSIYHRDSAPSAGQGNALDEIPLHMCSNTNNIARIYAATQDGKLLVSSQDANATSHTLTIKYKKIL